MSGFRQAAVALALVAVASVSLVSVSTAQTPPLPPLPIPIPDDDLAPLPSETARFRVVVEGVATARGTDNGTSDNGVCASVVSSEVRERSTYGRGKGLALEFVRFAANDDAISVRRAGRSRDASLAVVASVRRVVSGTATQGPSPTLPTAACPTTTEDLATTGTCGAQPFSARADVRFNYKRGRFDLDVVDRRDARLYTGKDCPKSEVLPEVAYLPNGWPRPPATTPLALAPSTIFGKRRGFTLKLEGVVPVTSSPYSALGISGTRVRSASNDVTVRFTRIRR